MTFWRWRQKGIIPEPMKIQNRNFWRRGELIAALLKAAEDPEL